VLAIAAAFVAMELAVAARYGIHRDELYFLACARHLAWGYVDQPPLVPAVARVSTALFGSSAVALRVFPALAGGGAVLMTAQMARELGGGRRAQIVAALAAATSAQVLGADHLLSTAAFDLTFWAAITLLVVRLLRTGDERLWLAVGAVAGVGMLNKDNVAFLLVGSQSGWPPRGTRGI
jgi:4-amino-4-deoxy-L-arabinose transferase-like glycosyltransferase